MVQGLQAASPIHTAKRTKEVTRFLESIVSSELKVVDSSDTVQIARQLGGLSQHKEVTWRSVRSYLVADSLQIGESSSGSASLSIEVGGFLRGKPLPVNSLGHIPGVGTCRIVQVQTGDAEGPYALARAVVKAPASLSVVRADPEKQDSLVLEACSDGISGEQTWPLDSELAGQEEGRGRTRREIKQQVYQSPSLMHGSLATILIHE